MAICRPTRSTWPTRAPTPWSARRPSSSRARRGGSSGTSTRLCAASTARPRRSASATAAARRSISTGWMRCRTRGSASPASSGKRMAKSRRNGLLFLWIASVIVVADVITKRLAVAELVPRYVPKQVIGDWIQLRLVYNQGAAFGIYLGVWSRWIFVALTVVAVVILARMILHTKEGDWFRVTAIAMVVGGALGNLIDRLRSAQGVVDFIDVGVGAHRWPTFN